MKSIIELKHQNNDVETLVAKRKSEFEKGLLQLDFLKKEILDLEKNIFLKKQKVSQLQGFIKEKMALLDAD